MKTENGLFSNLIYMYKGKVVDPGRRIRFCRHMRDMECKELALKAGIAPSYMSRIELNRTRCKNETYERVARAMNLSLDEMFGVTTINWNK